MKLLGEQINTKVAVLASVRAGGDANDLAGASLEDEHVANADVVAWNGDGVGSTAAAVSLATAGAGNCDLAVFNHDLLPVMVVILVVTTMNWVQHLIRRTMESVTEGVVVTVLVVVTHVAMMRLVEGSTGFGVDLDLFVNREITLNDLARTCGFVFPTTGVFCCERNGPLTIFALDTV